MSLNAQVENRILVTSAAIGVSDDTVRMRPVQTLTQKNFVIINYDQNVVDTQLHPYT